jgi:hypothetical protein
LSVIETVTVFVLIPVGIVLVIGGLVFALGGDRRRRRYRPGRPYDFAPVWFLSAPERLDEARDEARHNPGITGGTHGRAITTGAVETGAPRIPQGATGGASDRW